MKISLIFVAAALVAAPFAFAGTTATGAKKLSQSAPSNQNANVPNSMTRGEPQEVTQRNVHALNGAVKKVGANSAPANHTGANVPSSMTHGEPQEVTQRGVHSSNLQHSSTAQKAVKGQVLNNGAAH